MKRKLVSWNVNGIRATAKKGFVETFKELNTDVLCLQETKAPIEEVLKVVEPIGDYSAYINSSKNRKGYSGTCILSKEEPIDEIQDIGIYNHDQEGRVLSLEFSDYYLVNVYTPNSGSELARLDYRQGWNIDFKNFLLSLNRQKPVIVCGLNGRGVVATASYEARRYGIKSGQPVFRARKLCPQGYFVSPNFEKYHAASDAIYDIFYQYTNIIEPAGIDEAYLNVTYNKKGIPSATWIAQDIRYHVFKETGLTVSAGVAPNKLVAKIAFLNRISTN